MRGDQAWHHSRGQTIQGRPTSGVVRGASCAGKPVESPGAQPLGPGRSRGVYDRRTGGWVFIGAAMLWAGKDVRALIASHRGSQPGIAVRTGGPVSDIYYRTPGI